MKRIILNTANADEVSADKKDYKYYFKKPIVVNETSTLSLQAISQKQVSAGSSTPTSTGLLHLGGLTPYEVGGVPSTYGWTLNAGGYVEEMDVDLTNTAEAIVVASDGFTQKFAGVDFNGGSLKCLIYNDTTTTFNSPQTLLVLSAVNDLGSGFEAGWLIAIKKRPAGVTYTGTPLNDPLFTITSVKDSLMYQDGYLLYQESVGAFNPIVSQYAGEVAAIDANYTSPNIDLGQGLIVKFETNGSNPSLIQVSSIPRGGYGFGVGDYIYVNKASFLPSSSGTQFLLPLKIQVISNVVANPPQPLYDEGFLTIGNMAIDYTTIPTSIYGTFSNLAEWSVDLNDATKCSVFRSNGGASVGVDGELKFFTFKDYGTGGFPKTSVLAQITNLGKNYQAGDYIIINETAFPSGYLVAGSVNMRVDISAVSTSEIVQYPKGTITGLLLDTNYIGEVGTNTNYTHTPSTGNGQGTDFVWGSGSQYIELKQIVNGGYGFSTGDIFWVNKNDALPTSTYLTPMKVEVTAITDTATPPPPVLDASFIIKIKNLQNLPDNIKSSDADTNILVHNKVPTLHESRNEIMPYICCNIPPQVIMGMQLYIETFTGVGLTSNDLFIIDLKIM